MPTAIIKCADIVGYALDEYDFEHHEGPHLEVTVAIGPDSKDFSVVGQFEIGWGCASGSCPPSVQYCDYGKR